MNCSVAYMEIITLWPDTMEKNRLMRMHLSLIPSYFWKKDTSSLLEYLSCCCHIRWVQRFSKWLRLTGRPYRGFAPRIFLQRSFCERGSYLAFTSLLETDLLI